MNARQTVNGSIVEFLIRNRENTDSENETKM